MLRPLLRAAVLAVLAGTAGPAIAENVISLSLTARNTQEADLLRLGLALYAINRQTRDGAMIDQTGHNNSAGITQGDPGSFALIQQRGRDHFATLEQLGTAGAYAIFQSGKGAVAQVGDGKAGVLIQFGW